MELDLDILEYANVKLGGEKHKIRLPSVPEVHEFEKKLQDSVGKDVDDVVQVYSDYFSNLGLKADTAKKLNMYQFQRLHKSLSGLEEKK